MPCHDPLLFEEDYGEREGPDIYSQASHRTVWRETGNLISAAVDSSIRGAVKQLLSTYLGDSLPRTVAAVVQPHAGDLSDEDVRELIQVIERSKKKDTS